LSDINEYNYSERKRLEKAIELVKTGLNNETQDLVERFNTTVSQSTNYVESLSVRKNLLVEQNNKYLEGRISKEEDNIKNSNSLFEQEKRVLTSALEQNLVEIENKKTSELNKTAEQNLKDEENLERKIADFESQISKYNTEKEDLTGNQNSTFQSNKTRIDQRHNNKLVQISKELNEKVSKYKINTVDVDRATEDETNKFDSDKQQVQRNYDNDLSKGLFAISQKLQNDIKNI
jgi:hypothetical protein